MIKETHFKITPLGAAVVEAMPDQKLIRFINKEFKRFKTCPVSDIFDAAAIHSFYEGKVIAFPKDLVMRSYKKKRDGKVPT